VLNIEFCNVFRGGFHISLTFLLFIYWLANELKIPFWFQVHEFTHVQSCLFQFFKKNLGNHCSKICLDFLKLYVMASVCASLCVKNQVQLIEMVCTIAWMRSIYFNLIHLWILFCKRLQRLLMLKVTSTKKSRL
jgi:hypothetical protein